MNEKQVKDLLFAEFLKWMVGQTVGESKDGETIYYTQDVLPFVDGVKKMRQRFNISD